MDQTYLPPEVANSGRVPTIVALTWVQCSVALMVGSARIFTRGYRVRNISMDDYGQSFSNLDADSLTRHLRDTSTHMLCNRYLLKWDLG